MMKHFEFLHRIAEIQERKVLNEKLRIPSLRELIQITTNRKNWHLRTPYQKWCFLYGIGKIAMLPTGYTLFEENQTIRLRSYVSTALLAVYMSMSLHTTLYFAIHGEFSRGLLCTCLLGVGLSLIPLVVPMLSEIRKQSQYLVSYEGRHIYSDDHRNNKYNRMCSDQIDATIRAFFTKIAIINFFFICQQIGPTYEFIYHGIRTTLTELKFPFIPENSDAEFIANLIFQALALLLAGLAYVALEIAMQLANDLASIAPQLVHHELEIFRDMIADTKLTKAELVPVFRNIIKLCLNSDNIINCWGHVLYYRTLVTPITFTYAIAMSIFCQYALNYMAGYGIALLAWVQLFYICDLSQNIEDNGFLEVYQDFVWYKMPIKFQKDFILLINQKQNGATFTVGPFGTINRELFSDVSKTVYTLVMFLMNLHKK